MQKSAIIRIEGNDYIWSLEKVTNQCYLLMSSVKKLLHKYPTLWSKVLSCKLFNSWKIQKIRQLQNCNQGLQPPLPTIFQDLLTQVLFSCSFFNKLRLHLTIHDNSDIYWLKVDNLVGSVQYFAHIFF